jgi:hypothetical protein
MFYDLCLHREARAKRDWIRQAWHVQEHRADVDTLHDSGFEWVLFNVLGCLARRFHISKWTIGAVRGKEGGTFAARWGWRRWLVAREGKRRRLALQDSLFGSLGGSTLKTGEEGYAQLAWDVLVSLIAERSHLEEFPTST